MCVLDVAEQAMMVGQDRLDNCGAHEGCSLKHLDLDQLTFYNNCYYSLKRQTIRKFLKNITFIFAISKYVNIRKK